MHSFWAEYILFELKKSTGELSFMTMKRDTKFGEESTFFSKLTLGTSQILTWALESLKIFHFNGLFSRKVYVVWAKKSTEELSFITLKRDIKFREESTCRFKIDLRNLTNSDLSTRESLKNLHFHLFLLCKVFHVWPKKVQRSFLLWHWWVMQNLKKKKWLVVWKMTWWIWQIFTRALESVKIGTLMGSFCPK